MTTSLRQHFILTIAALFALAAASSGQQAFTPHIGYVFPAGGKQGALLQIKVGGQYLNGVTNVSVTGQGVRAEIIDYNRPLTPQQANDLRKQLKELQEKRANATNHESWTPADMRAAAEIRSKLAKFQNRSATPAIAETVTLKISISTNAELGAHELRLGTPLALSDPLSFCVGQLTEFDKPVAVDSELPKRFRRKNDSVQKAVEPVESRVMLPCVINGQILPGGVDRYRFRATAGQHLVIAVAARDLMPYLADAVPGWFQAALSLYDSQGHEVAYADHFRFHPDPVLYYEVPKNGEYVIQIRDSIYRGREDFVYRITAGELPYVTGIFPLGGSAGKQTIVKLTGWNLPSDEFVQDSKDLPPGICRISGPAQNQVPFLVDSLPECLSRAGNYSAGTAQHVTLPVIINGRVERPGQWSVFRFDGRAGEEIVAEVMARRLDSPLDSVLKLTDEAGKQLAFNDDFEDKGAGLQTQYADSYLRATLPETGSYYIYLGDAQEQGGPDYSYRLRISTPRPDFALRVVPSSLTVRSGMAAPLTVYALRKDGFSNEIAIVMKDAPSGFVLSGGAITVNQNEARLTLTAPAGFSNGIIKLSMEGRARIGGRETVHAAVPSQDMMQAFAYWHLVPSQDLEVSVLDRPQLRFTVKILDPIPLKIPCGGAATVRVRTPGRAANNNFRLELDQPPDGITIASVVPEDAATKIVFQTDAAKIKPGFRGNLIVNILANRARSNAAGKKGRGNQRSVALGTLPAIPFEIVSLPLLAK